jgi:hypothetical protein
MKPDFVTATPDGKKVFSMLSSTSPGSLYGYSVKPSNGKLVLTSLGEITLPGSNCQDVAVSADGKHVYPACGAPYEFDVFSGTTMQQVQTLAASNYPNNAEIDANDSFYGGITNGQSPDDVFVYNQKGHSRGNVPVAPGCALQGATVKISGDATRLVAACESGGLAFRNTSGN